MRLKAPVLRSPPFPGVSTGQAAISEVLPLEGEGPAPPRPDPSPPRERLRALRAAIITQRVGGSFWAPAPAVPARLRVLLRPATDADAAALAERALAANPPDTLLALLPEAGWAARARRLLERRGIAVEIGDVDPWPLLACATELHADGNDELALLALLAGLEVHCHADGPVAGRGLTRDAAAIVRKEPADLEMLMRALLVDGIRYRDCYSGAAAAVEGAVAQLVFWRGVIDANRGIAAGAGIAAWKRREITAMLWPGRRTPLRFFARAAPAVAAAAATPNGAIAVWPSRMPVGLEAQAAAADVSLWQVEDGFVRSVGLGSGLHPPLSVVVDSQGIHYDPTRPSDLETILERADFPPELAARAERLIAHIVQAGISKYAVGRDGFVAQARDGRRCVLVPGQVEDDLSVRRGGGAVRGNLDLLRRVRAAEPGAVLLFKPHPDVVAGHRAGHVADADVLAYADEIVGDVPMAALLDAVDAVHVLTSLAGFEALLRGREVVTHGSPFYSGWGLTRDLAPPLARRTRRLTLAELVAGAMILYSRYLDPVTGLPCPPEILLERLAAQHGPTSTWLTRLRGLQGRLRGPRALARSAA